MYNLKELLFELTRFVNKQYTFAKRTYGDEHINTIRMFSKLCVLYDLIEAAGLEDKYRKWKQHLKQ